ncbi:hypothetical protein BFP72_13220 [Reichenbachiella sp. 5M10]|uniref:hypothetical protein n=1 Tax=Reichenbachiella sp. 5M10 TaxID=1889772 RepID=UPI000C154010|nr:hypothetical protein [Reichenbachiella sp. 5M10]PIB36284.1 hypothetical protein BFP72_13220 [Reichenbachiella sp. 5M10]
MRHPIRNPKSKKRNYSFFFMSFFCLLGFGATAQDSTSEILSEYNITLEDITRNVQPTSKAYSFELKCNTPDPQYPTVYEANYNPNQKPAWQMTSWNGKKPEKYATAILKDVVKKSAKDPVKVNESSLSVKSEGGYAIISFRLDPNTVPKRYMYLKDCDGKAYINTESGRLEKTVWDNYKPTRNAIVKVNKLHEEVMFTYQDGDYLVIKETQFMGGSVKTRVGEKSGEANQIISYSNYQKVP